MVADRQELGGRSEQLVVQHLERLGYEVHDRNVRCKHGELDIVAEKDDVLCFVEVRSASTGVHGDPAVTVARTKQRKVVLSAMEWLTRHRQWERMIRFDVASVIGRGKDAVVEHLPAAFDAGF